jgi:hypothetical protein
VTPTPFTFPELTLYYLITIRIENGEEIMQRFSKVEVVEEPTLLKSNFVAGITRMPVRLHPL